MNPLIQGYQNAKQQLMDRGHGVTLQVAVTANGVTLEVKAKDGGPGTYELVVATIMVILAGMATVAKRPAANLLIQAMGTLAPLIEGTEHHVEDE